MRASDSSLAEETVSGIIPILIPIIIIIIIIIIILGTAHVLRKVLMYKYNRFNTETNDISSMNSNNRIAATLYSLGTQFVSGI